MANAARDAAVILAPKKAVHCPPFTAGSVAALSTESAEKRARNSSRAAGRPAPAAINSAVVAAGDNKATPAAMLVDATLDSADSETLMRHCVTRYLQEKGASSSMSLSTQQKCYADFAEYVEKARVRAEDNGRKVLEDHDLGW